jgi:hypothetical protein
LHHVWLFNRQRRAVPPDDQDQDQDPGQDLQLGNDRRLRNKDDLYEPFSRIEHTARLPYFSYPKLWNSLTLDCKSSSSLNILCNKLKLKFLNNYSNATVCNRLFCPVCRLRV